MYDALCVGILVADVLAKPVDAVPEKGLLNLVDSIEMFNGGNAMTAAVNLRKMGLSSAIGGKVGKDPFGDFLRTKLEQAGVETRGLAVSDRVQTSVSVALSASDGERSFLHCIGANGEFCLDDINWDLVEQCRTVFVTGSFLLPTFDGEQTAQFLKRCKEMGKTTLLDVCWDSRGNWGTLLNPCMPYLDYFLPSIEEAVMLAKVDSWTPSPTEISQKIAGEFFSRGVKSVVIKLGSKGCFAQESAQAEPYILPAYTHIKPVDTTGAGDSFCSGFIAALCRGESFLDCARFANGAGAHCVMEKGATTGMKPYEEIKQFMEANPL
ncbi:MAG: carbohydrate kinase family protein [Massiliimalia sp.]|jgi:sugar/nucleoside kinase (ribokinase family)